MILTCIEDSCPPYKREYLVYTEFEDQGEFNVDIVTISNFPEFEMSSSSTSICDISSYTFKFQLGYGNLSVGDYVHFTVPNSVTDCDETSISFRKFCSITYISSTGHLPVESLKIDHFNFRFKNNVCHNLNGSEIEFQITCLNPETTKPTGDFILQTQTNTLNSSIFYKSIGQSLTMVTRKSFPKVEFIILNTWVNYPNILQCHITRNSLYPSTDIDLITLNLTAGIYIDQNKIPNLSDINGIIPSTIGISYSEQIITLKSIKELAHEFSFILHNVLNSNSIITEIIIKVSAENSLGYLGEYGTGNPTYARCDYPCKTCENILVAQCLTCFPHNHVVFGNLVAQPYLYVPPPIKQCVQICPSHYYKNSPDSCGICDPNCLECNITGTNCTDCYANTILFDSHCMEECDLLHYLNIETRTCDLCNLSCKGCIGPTNLDCLQCDALYVFNNKGVCEQIACQDGQYLDIHRNICISNL